MKKVIYVTGCLGFIGSYITETCLKRGYYVIGVDKITYAAQPKRLIDFNHYGQNFKFIKEDINDLKSLYDCDYIINTAAETHVDNSIVSSDEFIHSNVNGVKHLLELVRKKGKFKMPTLLHMSTDETYGDIVKGSHIESDLLKPSNPYSATKAAADMLILAWGRTFNIPYIIVRPTNNYGIGQYVEKLIPKTCKCFLLEKKVPLHNKGIPRRVWLHAQDTTNAILTIVDSGIVNEIYNISGVEEYSNLEVVEKIRSTMFPDNAPLSTLDFNPREDISKYCDFTYSRDGQDVRYSLDDNKIKKLGWTNQCVFDKELPNIVEYYKHNFIW